MRGDWLRSMKCQLTIAFLTERLVYSRVDRDAIRDIMSRQPRHCTWQREKETMNRQNDDVRAIPSVDRRSI